MRLVCIHGFDPRGPKVGGIETHVRQLLRRHPPDMRALIIGVDDFGDLELGRMHAITFAGREFDFVPVLHVPSAEQTDAASSVAQSLTFRFAMALLRWLPRLRGLVGGGPIAAEIERFEYAPIARALGCPFVLVAHNEGDPRTDKMDSILSRHWYVNSAAEWIAVNLAAHVFGVTRRIRDRLATRFPRRADDIEVLTVAVDTAVFKPTPFDLSSGKLKLVYAGRLDEFKDPRLMFRVVRRVHEALNGAVEFHFCGSADPHRFAEFAAIEPYTVRHGPLTSDGVAAVMREAHIGILVSHWEGMPCFLLELLASGRPFAGLRLPQYDQVVEHGVSGRMVDRVDDPGTCEAAVLGVVLDQWADIVEGRANPGQIHGKILPWSVDNQLGRLFNVLRKIAFAGRSPVPASPVTNQGD
ncbi:glycosyltransferase family 4 protein [Sphingomonas sp.]|uniref:glycosyltransferase family 4 protein n=1 Tax=Sphingomonas sp. TaxID=28214 RepID=UPI003AFF8698